MHDSRINKAVSTNWAGNITFPTSRVLKPTSVEQLRDYLADNTSVKVCGTGHSFNLISDTSGRRISLEGMPSFCEVDSSRRVAIVDGHSTYATVAKELDRRGFALHNLASLPDLSIAGAIGTATHGSGFNNGNLATAVRELTFMDASGKIHTFNRETFDRFPGLPVHMGALGVALQVVLDVQPAYRMGQKVYLNVPKELVYSHFEELQQNHYSVSLFTCWRDGVFDQVWIKDRVTVDGDKVTYKPFEEYAAQMPVHPIIAIAPRSCTNQLGEAGSWYDRLPHFKIGETPSYGAELQSELFVPFAQYQSAFEKMFSIGGSLSEQLLISEVRVVAPDDLWMSPAYQERKVGIHCTWRQSPRVQEVLIPLVENALADLAPIPHWGKLFSMGPKIFMCRIPRAKEFRALVESMDPIGKFRNQYLDEILEAID